MAKKRPIYERFWDKVRKTRKCWEWTGGKTEDGYGRMIVGVRGRPKGQEKHVGYVAHRLAYEMLIGLIPEGMVLDHLCRNRGCVNPAHLEPVTQKENLRRGRTAGLKGRAAKEYEAWQRYLASKPPRRKKRKEQAAEK